MLDPYLPIGLDTTAKMIAIEANRVGEASFDVRPDPDRFSFREVVAHLADWEPILRGRLETAVNTPGATIAAYAEGARAEEMGYRSWNVSESAGKFLAERRKTQAWLKTLKPEDWDKSVVHPERGVLTVRDLANMLLGHDLYHIEHLTQYLSEKTVSTW